MSQSRVAIISSSRTPFCKSFTSYKDLSMQQLMTESLTDLVSKMNLGNQILDDVAIGSVIMQSSAWNFARECSLGSGLNPATPAFDIRRACGTSLEAAIAISNKIQLGQAKAGIAGGVDSNSDIPMEMPKSFAKKMIQLNKAKTAQDRINSILQFRLDDLKPQVPGVTEPRTGLSMGQHCEKMAQEWKISRADQDQLAFESHRNAEKAYSEGFYNDLVCEASGVKKDGLVRGSTTVEKLSSLKTVFDRSSAGTLTAGNSTALTDGAASVLLASEEYAKEKGWPVLAYLKDVQVSAVDFVAGEGLLMAPTVAVGKLLKKNNMKLQDFDYYEIHEAFAAQVLCTLEAWKDEKYCQEKFGMSALGEIDRSKMNVNGGSVALGHPFAATGARIIGGLAKILDQGSGRTGLISICTGGGMGIAAILEKPA